MTAERNKAADWRGYVAAPALVGLATGAGVAARGHFADPDFVMLYLLAISVAATVFGRGPALLSSALSVLAYDFFFVAPNYTFAVADERHVLTFATLFIVGLAVSALAEAARNSARRARTEELRSSLLSAVSHDLRTPLGAITGAASALRDKGASLDPRQREELADAICVEAARLERLVGNLLDMSRLDSGTLQVKREWVPLEEVVGAALTRAEGLLGPRPVRTDLPRDLPLLSADPVLLEQLFFNLFENASKYSPPDAAVEVTARKVGDAVQVQVADHGPGLPKGTEAQVFEKFYRGQAGGAVPGAGLGLAICRAIVQAHGGSLRAANAPRGGAVFTLVLPLPGQAPAVPAEPLEHSP